MMGGVDPGRLEMLLELSRLGSMRAVAETLHVTTSTVSQQIAVLAREAGTPLIEPEGRRVRLTPAGRRLADHAVTILAALEAARCDLDPDATPAGVLRVAAFATGVRRSLLPVVGRLATTHPDVRLMVHEYEPGEALDLLVSDDMDLALTYDYNLAPAAFDPALTAIPLWEAPWGLAVPRDAEATEFAGFRDHDWIVNSRNTADDEAVRTVASLAGFAPRVTHRVDSLDLLEDLVVAGLGVGLLPADRPTVDGVRVLPLSEPVVMLRALATVRRGRAEWPPLALVLDLLAAGEGA
jgi:DNA-binding transcriptional LysR family regulator